MSIPEIIYIIGGLCSIIIFAYIFFTDIMEDEDIKVKDLGVLLIVEAFAFFFSWIAVLIIVFLRYEDTVVIKRKKKK